MRKGTSNSYKKGIWAEYLAAFILFFRFGLIPLCFRYKTKFGEVDIIARPFWRFDKVVFIEVKFRQRQDDAAYSVHPASRKRIRDAASYFLSHNLPNRDLIIRFDVVLISPYFKIRIIQNAF